MSEFNLKKSQLLAKINSRLDELLEPTNYQISHLIEAMRYAVLNNGKRIRPLLTIAAGELVGANLDNLINVGCAIELIHCYSLVHDDLPSMDNDDLRRGKPSCHKKFGEATAILVGDALQSLAFEVLSAELIRVPDANKLDIIQLLAINIGSRGLAGGQDLDLLHTGKQLNLHELQQIHLLKTGALIQASILAGFLCNGDRRNEIYTRLAEIAGKMGLLFQIVDDILDVTKSTSTLGKTANKDLLNEKATYVRLLGIDETKKIAHELFNEITIKLKDFKLANLLIDLTTSIYNRNN